MGSRQANTALDLLAKYQGHRSTQQRAGQRPEAARWVRVQAGAVLPLGRGGSRLTVNSLRGEGYHQENS